MMIKTKQCPKNALDIPFGDKPEFAKWLLIILLLVSPTQGMAKDLALPGLAMPAPEGAKQLAPDEEIWVDAKQKRVYVNGRVVLREGVLEMFACPKGTKEHESVIAVKSKAFLIHTALLAVGAEPGKPVQFEPKFIPPHGTEIDITIVWFQEAGDGQEKRLKSAKAQDWIRNVDTKEAMQLPFVFAGSGFWTDPDTGKQRYLAEAGDLICVSNFGSAMIDVPIESTQSNEGLLFEPFTERIPPEETPIRMVLTPVDKKAGA